MSRKITRSRKGVVFFLPILAVIVLVGMTYGLIVIQNKQEIPSRTGAIGQNPLEVVMKIQEGEKAMIFMDTASRFALYQALYDLQETGGLAEGSECGEYYGFNLWNGPGDQDCSADIDTVEESLRDLFTVNIIARAAAYPDADFVGQLPGMAVERGELVVSEGAAAVDLPEEVGAGGAPAGTETGTAPSTAGSVGDKVIIYLPPNTGTSPDLAFRARANAMAQRIGARTYPATNGQEILDAIRRHEQIGVLIIAGHGSSRDFLRPSRAGIRVGPDALSTWVSVDTFAQELAPRLAPGAI
ncbi:hypothetical protein KY362_01085, partial [Candidatus Woesearchaeota archaeon]|nr:hypothetical protein [Candidatus Woesearchaeota archaeon]